ncbi:MAG: thiamine-phosphate kinase [Gammaproteobacteria bacterium]|nr:thiamine-phosphate kinase [Gammaproteobacteria bacterium]
MAGGPKLDEDAIIRRYFQRPAGPDVLVGIGDDGAITRLAGSERLVTAVDTLVAGVHFPARTPPHAVGHRVLAVNLSDLAAMAARPRWATLSLSIPSADGAWVREFAAGFFALARRHRVSLIGGDTVRGPLNVSVTALGSVAPDREVRRTGARPGDGVFVTGYPGEAVAGRLLLARRGRTGALEKRFLYPQPRVSIGRALAGVASAMIDVSDGLHHDLGKLLNASGVGADLEVPLLPLSRALLGHCGVARARRHALMGGDDYELAFTAGEEESAIIGKIASRNSCRITRIGTVSSRRGLRWRLDGQDWRVRDSTFAHFL